MIKIVTTSEVNKDKVAVTCNVELMGKRFMLISELASILGAIEDKEPDLIGDALQLMIAKAEGTA